MTTTPSSRSSRSSSSPSTPTTPLSILDDDDDDDPLFHENEIGSSPIAPDRPVSLTVIPETPPGWVDRSGVLARLAEVERRIKKMERVIGRLEREVGGLKKSGRVTSTPTETTTDE